MHSVLTQFRALTLPLDLQLILFDHTVVPILLYGEEIWGHESHEVQEKFLRKIANAKNQLQGTCYMVNWVVTHLQLT